MRHTVTGILIELDDDTIMHGWAIKCSSNKASDVSLMAIFLSCLGI